MKSFILDATSLEADQRMNWLKDNEKNIEDMLILKIHRIKNEILYFFRSFSNKP